MSILSARRAIRSLRVGVVPSSHVIPLSVGISSVQKKLDSQIGRIGNNSHNPIVIRGEWGSGKSNLLCFMREYGLENKMAVAYLNLNGRSAAVNHPQRYYHRIMTDMRFPNSDAKGIINLLRSMKDSTFKGEALKKIANYKSRNSEIATALRLYFEGHEDYAIQILLGSDLYWASYDYKKRKALERLNDMGEFLQCLGYSGLMIQFDELESIDQLPSITSRRSAYTYLYYIINLKHVLPVFASTEKLNRVLKLDLESNRLHYMSAKRVVQQFLNIDALEPPEINLSRGRVLAERIERLYRGVYKVAHSTKIQTEVVERWSRMAYNNPRRLIRNVVNHLDLRRL